MNKSNGQADTETESRSKSAKAISGNEERNPIFAAAEVTPDMIREGVAELLSYGSAEEISRTSYDEIVQSVYLAMQHVASPIPCRESERL